MRVPNKWAQAQIWWIEWLACKGHGSTDLWKFWKMVNIWEGTLNKITVILPNNFELPQFRVFALQMLRIGSLLTTGCPRLTVPNQMQLLCLLILNFCIDRPFRFSVHRDANFCLSRLFRFSAYRAVLLFLGKVFFWLHLCLPVVEVRRHP